MLIIVLILTTVVVCFACDKKNKNEMTSVTITFDTGFDDVVIKPIVLDGVTEQYMPADPIKLGYEFLGWFYDDKKTLPFSTSDAITMDITLHAKWYAIQNGNTGESAGRKDVDVDTGLVYEEIGDYYAVVGYSGTDTGVTIPSSYNLKPVRKIKKTAFINTLVTRVGFGRVIDEVEEGTFNNASYLERIEVEEGSLHYCSEGGVLYNAQKTTLVCAPVRLNATSFVLPVTVNNIVKYALLGCTFDLTFAAGSAYNVIDEYDLGGFAGKVTIDNNITSIRRHAFNGATCKVIFAESATISELAMQSFENYSGSELTLPGTINSIKPYAFAGCTAKIDLSRLGLTVVTSKAFASYAGANLVIPATVNDIESYAFASCTAEITFEFGSVYAEVKSDAFASYGGTISYVDNNGQRVVEYRGKVTLPSSVHTVSAAAFRNSKATIVFDNARSDVTIDGDLQSFGGEIIYLK